MDFRIPVAASLATAPASLPIEPYLMGYWLGNGHHCKPEITIQTADVEEVLFQITPHHAITSVWDNVGDSKIVRINDLRPVLLQSFHDKVIAFGDFANYWIADRAGFNLKRLGELFALNDQVGFTATKRLDGKTLLKEGIKLLQMS